MMHEHSNTRSVGLGIKHTYAFAATAQHVRMGHMRPLLTAFDSMFSENGSSTVPPTQIISEQIGQGCEPEGSTDVHKRAVKFKRIGWPTGQVVLTRLCLDLVCRMG